MKVKYTAMTINITPDEAKSLGEGLIHFSETCKENLSKNNMGKVAKNVLFHDHETGFTFLWEPIEKEGKVINLKTVCSICGDHI